MLRHEGHIMGFMESEVLQTEGVEKEGFGDVLSDTPKP